jgi:tRNA/rRNA methyltransferase
MTEPDRSDPAQPAFVLVRPQMGENIGAAARAMWNFGLSGMRLVAPRDGWPNPTATAMASGAGRILDRARLFEDVAGAIGDCTYVMATTARERDMTKPVLSPERAMQEAVARITTGQRVAMLFGPERAGLDNDDVARANALVSVPVNPEFPSLNLAQCVLLCAYEWRRATADVAPVQTGAAGSDEASAVEIARLADHYEARLDEAGFFYPEHKAARMKRNLRNLWSRMPLTGADVRILHGIMRQMVRRDGRG